MTTMLDTIVPKSDQLNADDLIGRAITITVTKIVFTGDEQPVAVHFEGDNGKPYMPNMGMRRVMVHIWGDDANNYIGKSMTIYRDDKVLYGGFATGGIRISHMSGIDKDVTMALTESKKKRKPFTVRPLRDFVAQSGLGDTTGYHREKVAVPTDLDKRAAAFDGGAVVAAEDEATALFLNNLALKLGLCLTVDDVHGVVQLKSVSDALANAPEPVKREINAMLAERYAQFDNATQE